MKFESRVDGHVLMCRDGSIRWLSIWERLKYLFGLTTADKLDTTSVYAAAMRVAIEKRKAEEASRG